MKSQRLFFYSLLTLFMPATKFFGLKRAFLKFCGARVGSNTKLVSSAKFLLTGQLTIGDSTWVGHEVLVVGGDADVAIGNHCDIAPRVTFVTGSHSIDPTGIRVAGNGFSSPISIGDGCWICTGATILGGSNIGDKCVVAAGAVVHGDFPGNKLIGGIPARVIRDLSI